MVIDAMSREATSSIWRLTSKQAKPLAILNAGNIHPPIYCIHAVSGDIVGLREIAQLLGDQRVFGIQVPKGSMNGEFASSIEAIAGRYVDLIRAAQPDGPMALAGWSAGAVIALEMAQRLRDVGREVSLLIALDGAPCNTGALMSGRNPLYALRLIVNFPRWLKDESLRDWTPSAIIDRLEGKVAYRFGPKASSIFRGRDTLDADCMRDVAETRGWSTDQKCFMHAMYKSMLAYTPRTYDGKVVVYETKTQPLYHLRQIGTAWKKIARATDVVRLDGRHSNLIAQPMIGQIACDLLQRLNSTQDDEKKRCSMVQGASLKGQHGARAVLKSAMGLGKTAARIVPKIVANFCRPKKGALHSATK